VVVVRPALTRADVIVGTRNLVEDVAAPVTSRFPAASVSTGRKRPGAEPSVVAKVPSHDRPRRRG
jgi:hypothetical protein